MFVYISKSLYKYNYKVINEYESAVFTINGIATEITVDEQVKVLCSSSNIVYASRIVNIDIGYASVLSNYEKVSENINA